ncbi:hypothetical protein [Paludifilum halophilum]|uniref:hypothetical protein n=1 Tax=Paludifilum halophilum TaxID=1642702 RepID=UPI00113FCDC0|nr:hypothetical protein [Paludifilum halophilum]
MILSEGTNSFRPLDIDSNGNNFEMIRSDLFPKFLPTWQLFPALSPGSPHKKEYFLSLVSFPSYAVSLQVRKVKRHHGLPDFGHKHPPFQRAMMNVPQTVSFHTFNRDDGCGGSIHLFHPALHFHGGLKR